MLTSNRSIWPTPTIPLRPDKFQAQPQSSYTLCRTGTKYRSGQPVLFYILQRLFPDRRVAPLATLLTAIDFIFLWGTADARMDAPASALALCSVSAYLYFREKDYQKAVAASKVLGACAVFTHPNSALVILAGIDTGLAL